MSQVQNESRAHKVVLGEMERAREETKRQKVALDRLHEEVASRQQESMRSASILQTLRGSNLVSKHGSFYYKLGEYVDY